MSDIERIEATTNVHHRHVEYTGQYFPINKFHGEEQTCIYLFKKRPVGTVLDIRIFPAMGLHRVSHVREVKFRGMMVFKHYLRMVNDDD